LLPNEQPYAYREVRQPDRGKMLMIAAIVLLIKRACVSTGTNLNGEIPDRLSMGDEAVTRNRERKRAASQKPHILLTNKYYFATGLLFVPR
jgi:hypothetical protein